MGDPMTYVRAVRTLGDTTGDERQRQTYGRAGLAAALSEPRLAGLVECSICGLLDENDPCGDHDEEADDAS